ncbi:hypothetical protein PVA44_07660 (plasmid) [Entomospira nematocerorum]|uniref:Uncharacterized protein n=1 Tax=Entomospira nematocerorum TaxID=2719987 RepID=A0A968GGD9_9SPIO|nr:hypothetical protein [Entomospira nematocera]NIZ47788.1 hypothetical protein [Entomospira nematocera]WDI34766.1 hypothetical protein PVA44_07660 [Entomospira nematocera]
MNITITFPRGLYRKMTGRRQPNHRRLQKMLKNAGWYHIAELYIRETPLFLCMEEYTSQGTMTNC